MGNLQNPLRMTRTSHSNREMSLNLFIVCYVLAPGSREMITVTLTERVSIRVVTMLPADMTKIQIA